jgi:hypothetical protein
MKKYIATIVINNNYLNCRNVEVCANNEFIAMNLVLSYVNHFKNVRLVAFHKYKTDKGDDYNGLL